MRRRPLKAFDADSRPFIDHLVIDVGFHRDHALERVVELLENQGWGTLFLENYTLNNELTRQFFSTLTISDKESSLLAQFQINGLPYQFTNMELGTLLGVFSIGFLDVVKN